MFIELNCVTLQGSHVSLSAVKINKIGSQHKTSAAIPVKPTKKHLCIFVVLKGFCRKIFTAWELLQKSTNQANKPAVCDYRIYWPRHYAMKTT